MKKLSELPFLNTCLAADPLFFTQGMAVLHVQDAGTRLHLLNRSALRLVQAQARTPASQKDQVPTVSPWGEASWTPGTSGGTPHFSRKQEEYVKVSVRGFCLRSVRFRWTKIKSTPAWTLDPFSVVCFHHRWPKPFLVTKP